MDGTERALRIKQIRGKITELEEEIGQLETEVEELLREKIVIKGKDKEYKVSMDSIYNIRFDEDLGLVVEFGRGEETVVSKEEAIRLINLLGW